MGVPQKLGESSGKHGNGHETLLLGKFSPSWEQGENLEIVLGDVGLEAFEEK